MTHKTTTTEWSLESHDQMLAAAQIEAATAAWLEAIRSITPTNLTPQEQYIEGIISKQQLNEMERGA